MTTRFRAALAAVLVALGASGCATNPVTGGQDFVLMSEEQELALGREASRQIAQQYRPYDDPALQDYVQRIGEELAARSHRPNLVYRFTVVDSKEVNAFALPGGYIYITRGLLGYMNSEAELAGVLGHEIGHVTARHSVRQASAAQATGIGLTLGAIFFPELRAAGAFDLMNVLGTALLRGYGRDQELEADRLGAEYLARTGYSPDAILDVLGILKNQETLDAELAREEGREPRSYHGVFATHPDNDTRLQEVVGLARSLAPPGPPRDDGGAFLRALEELVYGDSEDEGIVRGSSFVHAGLGFGIDFPQGWSIRNFPDRLVVTAPGGNAEMQLLAEDLSKRIPPRQFMVERLGLRNLKAEGEITPSGLPGYSAVAPINTSTGRREARVNVVYFRDKAYIVVGTVKDRTNIAPYDQAFLATARSFHPVTPEEREASRALRIQLIEATPGMSFQSLASGSPLGHRAESQLRLLNGMYPSGEPKPGQLIKVVR